MTLASAANREKEEDSLLAAQVYRDRELQLPGSVLTIGAFDGMHLGHQALIQHVVRRAAQLGVPSVAYTFDPPPRVILEEARILMFWPEKVRRFASLGLDHTILAQFDDHYAERSIGDFLEELANINPVEVWVGSDFRFGQDQVGDVEMLGKFFTTRIFESVCCEKGQIVSSSRIRSLLEQGVVREARNLLAWTH